MGAQAPLKHHHFRRCFAKLLDSATGSARLRGTRSSGTARQRQCQMGSLAGAAHLSKDNAGVLWRTHGEQKSPVEQKGKSPLDYDFQCKCKMRKQGLSILYPSAVEARGVRQITTGITGLWQPSVHSDVAF